MAERKKTGKRNSTASQLLAFLDQYVAEVQHGPYVRRMQVALLWSAISLFYISFDLEVASVVSTTLLGVSVKNLSHAKFCLFLLIMTAYYTVMFSFVFAKVWLANHPRILVCELFRFRAELRSVQEYLDANGTKYKKGNLKLRAEYSDLALWASASRITHTLKHEEDVPESAIPTPPDMKNEVEVREFMVWRPIFALLENLLARMFFPAAVCAVALVFLVREIWC